MGLHDSCYSSVTSSSQKATGEIQREWKVRSCPKSTQLAAITLTADGCVNNNI